ncbi:MAG: glycerophosphodiester phosphodiesterase [Promethearchaeota archaeon]
MESVPQKKEYRTYIWAHRGASGYEVENTRESFLMAIEQGADGIESDVKYSKDGILYFYHDYRVKVGKKSYPFFKLTMTELKNINLQGKKRKIPTVDEIFSEFQNKRNKSGYLVNFSLDIANKKAGLMLIKKVEEYNLTSRVELTFDNYSWFKEFRRLNKEIGLTDSAKINLWKRISRRIFYRNFDKLKKFNVKAVNLKAADVKEKYINAIYKNGLKFYVWDCHSEESIKRFIDLHVDAIYTNYPDLAVKIRNVATIDS